jgi:3',5'-cyclic AMP phosphodiesterase CpdA
MQIIQISDTHLSPDKPYFSDNWLPRATWIADQHPDLVIHTGDVTRDGAGVEVDLSYSAQLMDELGIRWRAVPGNHDVGDPRHDHQPVNGERLTRGSVISVQIAGSKMLQKVRSAGVLSDST